MRNAEIADAFADLATLYELDGAVRYRVLAYREAARVIRAEPGVGRGAGPRGEPTELPGVGKTLAGQDRRRWSTPARSRRRRSCRRSTRPRWSR